MVLSRAAARQSRSAMRERFTEPMQRVGLLEDDMDEADRVHEMLLAKVDGVQRTLTGMLVALVLAVLGAALNLIFNAV